MPGAGDQLQLALEPTPPPATAPAVPGAAAGAAPHDPYALFRHPRANREIRLDEQPVHYELRRARRRSIGFVIGEDGLRVSAPRWVGQGDIDRALASKAGWILRKLVDQGERLRRIEAARIDWRDGARLPYLGEPLTLVLEAAHRGPPRLDEGPTGRRLFLGLPPDAETARVRDAAHAWLQRQALALFQARCDEFVDRLGVRITRLRLSSAQTRWGSASADGTVRLNWRLIHFALPTIDYVVAHELAHLREMNHSPAFWDVVRTVMPDYQHHRATLKDGAVLVID